jgi:hypothetical protein
MTIILVGIGCFVAGILVASYAMRLSVRHEAEEAQAKAREEWSGDRS